MCVLYTYTQHNEQQHHRLRLFLLQNSATASKVLLYAHCPCKLNMERFHALLYFTALYFHFTQAHSEAPLFIAEFDLVYILQTSGLPHSN